MKPNSIRMPKGFSTQKAHRLQLKLAKQVIRKDVLPKKIRLVAGVDVAYVAEFSVGAIAALNYESLELKEAQTIICRTSFPYIPTLLSFRETPPAVKVIKKMKLNPDILLVDAQGIMHPYQLGFGSHLGLLLNKPTIGVAKSPLWGERQAFNEDGWAPIMEKGEIIGAAVVAKEGAKPVYVSIGHKVSLETAIAIVKHCATVTSVPEPIRQAHIIATREKGKIRHRVKESCKGD